MRDDIHALKQEVAVNREAVLQATVLLQRIADDIDRLDDQLRELGAMVEYTIDG
jgi:hypothetical protein